MDGTGGKHGQGTQLEEDLMVRMESSLEDQLVLAPHEELVGEEQDVDGSIEGQEAGTGTDQEKGNNRKEIVKSSLGEELVS